MMVMVNDRKDVFKSIMNFGPLGLEMGLCVAIGIAIGYYLDKSFLMYPYMSIIFMFVGIAASMRSLYRTAKKMERENERSNSK
ncbi:MAG: AtpZ/AtpI family protein [Syntrophobacterales bacterium]|jgi:ATP synthase protein I|nr:AtpZ/AtpI family protein [Syntrophobacterales bacterium]